MPAPFVALFAALTTTFFISSDADSGPGTLRQAILDADRCACIAEVRLADANRTMTVTPQTPLPDITGILDFNIAGISGSRLTIDGAGRLAYGLRIRGAAGVRIEGLRVIGASGDGIVIDFAHAVQLASDDVSANGGNGIVISNSGSVRVQSTEIAGNRGNGIVVLGDTTAYELSGNSFDDNGGLAIDVGGDGVTAAGLPVIDSAVVDSPRSDRTFLRLRGHIDAKPDTRYDITAYASDRPDPSGYGEGRWPLVAFASVRTDANGHASWELFEENSAVSELKSKWFTALATEHAPDGAAVATSEFSRAVAVSAAAIHYTVTSTADSGSGSLREALKVVNDGPCFADEPCVIDFAFDEAPQSGRYTIKVQSPLDPIARSGVTIDGFGAGAPVVLEGSACAGACDGLRTFARSGGLTDVLIRSLEVRNFNQHGINVSSAMVKIDGCTIAGNRRNGIQAVSDTTVFIGTYATGRGRAPVGNVIISNGEAGLWLNGAADVSRNVVGADSSGVVPFGNRFGMYVTGRANITDNIIAFNREDGVILGSEARLRRNSIHSNGGRGINSSAKAAPLIRSARWNGKETEIVLSANLPITTTGAEPYEMELFASSFADASGRGEGKRWLTFWRVLDNRDVILITPENLAGKFLTATIAKIRLAADVTVIGTSEFSDAVQVTSVDCAPHDAPLLMGAFRWSAVAGATSYRLWLMEPGGAPRMAAETSATSATPALAAGTYEWWVEAVFPGCYGAQSAHGVTRR